MKGTRTRVLVLTVPQDRTPYGEPADPYQLGLIEASIAARGWQAALHEYEPAAFGASLAGAVPDVVLNLAYGYVRARDGVHLSQPDVADHLEALGYACVGAPSAVQRIAQDKRRCADALAAHGIASPRPIDPLRWPPALAFGVAKPRYGAYHRGVRFVKRGEPWTENGHGEMLLQEYVHGPEYTVAIIEQPGRSPRAMPLRIDFDGEAHGRPALMTWEDDSWSVGGACAGDADAGAASTVALRAFDALGLRDYARIDVRIGAGGPVVLDVNPLPGLDPESGLFALAAAAAGTGFHTLIWQLLDSALARRAEPPVAARAAR